MAQITLGHTRIMSKPTSSFDFKATGLSSAFTDKSVGIVVSRLWSFGYSILGVPVTSTEQNPTTVFPLPGTYEVSLASTNADGTDTYTRTLIVSESPRLNITIKEMVLSELPTGIALDSVVFSQSIRKWQLLLQEGIMQLDNVTVGISNEDVFDEAKWPSLANVLIAKLVIYEMILSAASSSMTAFLSASRSFNESSTNVTSGTMLVSDYEVVFDNAPLFTGGASVIVNMIMSNGIQFGPSPAFTTPETLLNWLNSLGMGLFIYSADKLKSLGNTNVLTTFNYTHSVNGGTNTVFTQTNQRVLPINTTVQVTAQVGGSAKGPIKRIETGPSNAEWYDGSSYWSQMFKGAGNSLSSSSSSSSSNGGASGVIAAIQSEACIYASKLKVRLPFCPTEKKVRIFQVGKY